MGRVDGPAKAIGPVSVARPSIDKQLAVIADGSSCGANDGFVELAIASSSEGSPANLERFKTLLDKRSECRVHAFGFIHKQRAVRSNARSINATQEPRDGLLQRFANYVPEGY